MSSGRAAPSAGERTTPLISIVIPVYNAEKYLAGCLDAIVSQAFQDIEIITVDGGSTDLSPEILAERVKSEPRLTIIRQDRIGPGRARNIGAAGAARRYLWFVDADDTIAPDCLSAIACRLEADVPDVLLIDYEFVYPDGRSGPGHSHRLMSRPAPACFTLREQPWVADMTMSCWNKIIRREFFRHDGVTFESKWPHEEIPVSCLLLLDARRLSILNQICYRYGKDRAGSVMMAGDPKRHFEVFNAWQVVMEQVAKRAEAKDLAVTDDVYRVLFQRAIWHFSTILDSGLAVSAGHARAAWSGPGTAGSSSGRCTGTTSGTGRLVISRRRPFEALSSASSSATPISYIRSSSR